jgi:tetratricopeptide (TPR) repeat protein
VDKLHQAFWGSYNEFAQDESTALTWYNRLLEEPDTPAYMHRGLVNLFARADDNSSILQLMPKLEHAFTDDVEMQLIFARALYNSGFIIPADEKIIMLAQKVKDHQEVTLLAAQMYMRRKELENAALVIKDYLAATPESLHHFVFYFCLAQIYMGMHQKDAALQATNKAVSLQPNFAKGWLMYGLLHEQMDQLDNALRGYTRYLAASGTKPPEMEQHLQRIASKHHELNNQSDTTKGLSGTQFKQAIELINQGKFQQAAEFIDSCLNSPGTQLSFKMPIIDEPAQEPTVWGFLGTLYTGGINFCRYVTKLFIKPLLPVKYSTDPYSYRVTL